MTRMEARRQRRAGLKRNIFLWTRDLGIALIVVVLLLQFLRPTIVDGSSMENTLYSKDYLLINKQAYVFGTYHRGDIIVLRSGLFEDDGSPKNFVKRIIGLPGDRVEIQAGRVRVNGEPLNESYTKEGITIGDMEMVTVPKASLFVLGDNRQHSLDSRSPDVGFVEEDEVIGRAIFRLFPINQIGVLSR